MPQKLGDNLSAGHKIKTFFPGAKIRNFQCTGNQLSVFTVVYRVYCHVTYGRTGHWAVGLHEQ